MLSKFLFIASLGLQLAVVQQSVFAFVGSYHSAIRTTLVDNEGAWRTLLYQAKVSNTLVDSAPKALSPTPKKSPIKGVASKTKKSASFTNVKGSSKTEKMVKNATKTMTKKKKTKKTATKKRKTTKSKTTPKEAKTETPPKTKTKRKAKTDKILHWSVDSDLVTLEDDQVRFKVHGNPLPLRRHRTSRGFVYNPSAPAQKSFANTTQQVLNATSSSFSLPWFPPDQPLAMTILFRTKRPNTHFVGSKPGPGRMRDTAPSQISLTRTDVDNLAKFVLDSLNGILYEDDRQICSLHVTKVLDNDGNCKGSTEISCSPLSDSDLSVLIPNSFDQLNNKD